MSENGEIYTAGKKFTLPLAVTAWTNSTSDSWPHHHCLVTIVAAFKIQMKRHRRLQMTKREALCTVTTISIFIVVFINVVVNVVFIIITVVIVIIIVVFIIINVIIIVMFMIIIAVIMITNIIIITDGDRRQRWVFAPSPPFIVQRRLNFRQTTSWKFFLKSLAPGHC